MKCIRTDTVDLVDKKRNGKKVRKPKLTVVLKKSPEFDQAMADFEKVRAEMKAEKLSQEATSPDTDQADPQKKMADPDSSIPPPVEEEKKE